MGNYVLIASAVLFALILLIGLLIGLARGLKRSAVHIAFFLVSILLAYFITKPIATAILNCNIMVDGSVMTINNAIIHLIEQTFDLSNFASAKEFIAALPNAIVSPILFLLLSFVCYIVFDIIYLIFARIVFGSKKKDFASHKPYRAYGAVLGVVEGLFVVLLMFGPVSSLTNLYADLAQPTAQAQSSSQNGNMQTISDMIAQNVPQNVHEYIISYNNSVIGKVSSLGGVNNFMFDGFASVSVKDEKINLRDELVSAAKTYDEVVVVCNTINSLGFEEVNIPRLKACVEKVVDNGLFKAVISDTIKSAIINFEDVRESFGIGELPELAENMITDLKTSFSQPEFDISAYLRHDILKVLDIAQEVIDGKLVSKVENLPDKKLKSVLGIVNENSQTVQKVANGFFEINIVKDCLRSISNYARKEASALISEEKFDLAIDLNPQDKKEAIAHTLEVVDEFADFLDTLDIDKIMNSSDIVSDLLGLENLEQVLTDAGKIVDDVRNLEFLKIIENETTTYALDQCLEKVFNVVLLGDVVTKDDGTEMTIDTYSKLFEHIKTPALKLKEVGVVDMLNNSDFSAGFDRILDEIAADPEFFNKTIMPFAQLKVAKVGESGSIKKIVFDELISTLKTNVTLIDFAKLEGAEDAFIREEFSKLGNIIKTMSSKEAGHMMCDKTYANYLTNGGNLKEFLKTSIRQNDLEPILQQMFASSLFETTTQDIFTQLDNFVKDETGLTVTSDLTNLSHESTIPSLVGILDIALNVDAAGTIELPQIGKILDLMKANAYNDGAKDGVFNNAFEAIIYYFTGDDITATNKFAGCTSNADIDWSAYLEITDVKNGYYTVASYEEKFALANDGLKLLTDMNNNVTAVLSDSTIAEFVTQSKGVIDTTLSRKTNEEKAKIINDLKKVLDQNSTLEPILTAEEIATYGERLSQAISAEYGETDAVGLAIKNLLGV